MDFIILLKALLLGIVEGLTEFLPVSSTGHLIVVGDLINFYNEGKVFEVAIQLGAILAVVFEYRKRFISVATGITHDKKEQQNLFNVIDNLDEAFKNTIIRPIDQIKYNIFIIKIHGFIR